MLILKKTRAKEFGYMTARKNDILPLKIIKKPYKAKKGHTRPYKAIHDHTRHAKSNEATHGDGRDQQKHDHTRPHKAIQGKHGNSIS